ncbi:hypothetical protein ACQ4PT_061506 [Festuca glaucescens]
MAAGKGEGSGSGSADQLGSEPSLEDLLESLNLKGEDIEGVFVAKKDVENLKEEAKWMAVIRLQTTKPFSAMSLKKTLRFAWVPAQEVFFRDIEGNMLLVQASCLGDWERITEQGPWLFRDYGLLVEKYDGSCRAGVVELNRIHAWARIYDVPELYRKKHMIMGLAESIGEVLDMDMNGSSFEGDTPWNRARLRGNGQNDNAERETQEHRQDGPGRGRGHGAGQAGRGNASRGSFAGGRGRGGLLQMPENRKRTSADASLTEVSPVKGAPTLLLQWKEVEGSEKGAEEAKKKLGFPEEPVPLRIMAHPGINSKLKQRKGKTYHPTEIEELEKVLSPARSRLFTEELYEAKIGDLRDQYNKMLSETSTVISAFEELLAQNLAWRALTRPSERREAMEIQSSQLAYGS